MNRNNSITERQKGKGHIACACQTYKTNNSTGKNHRKHISSKKTMIWSIQQVLKFNNKVKYLK